MLECYWHVENIAWRHHFTKRRGCAIKTTSTTFISLATFYWSASIKPGKLTVMYLCAKGINFPLSTILIFYFKIVPTVWYFLFFSFNFLVSRTLPFMTYCHCRLAYLYSIPTFTVIYISCRSTHYFYVYLFRKHVISNPFYESSTSQK